MSFEEYLEFELESEVRHEYFGGTVIEMAGETARHNKIVGKVFARIFARLEDGPGEVFVEGVKLRLFSRSLRDFVAYYPDLMVVCDPDDHERLYRERPKLIIEVLSSDRNKDFMEKYLAYQSIESMEEFVIIDPENRGVYVFRKSANWEQELVTEGEAELRSIDLKLNLDDVYAGL